MPVAQIIGLLVKLSILSTVFALGLNATWADVTYLLRRPGLFARSFLAMYLLTPLAAVLLVLGMTAPRPVEIAVLLMAISTGAPLLPRKLLKLGGRPRYIYSLAVIMALLAIATVPLSLALLGELFGQDVSVAPGQVASTLMVMFLGPLLVGVLVRSFAPSLAERIGEPITKVAGIIILVVALLIVVINHAAIMAVGLSGFAIILLTTGASLGVGHALGGPEPEDRTSLAVACSTRFPGLAMLVASLNFPNAKPLPVVVAYLLISTLAAIPYLQWRKGRYLRRAA